MKKLSIYLSLFIFCVCCKAQNNLVELSKCSFVALKIIEKIDSCVDCKINNDNLIIQSSTRGGDLRVSQQDIYLIKEKDTMQIKIYIPLDGFDGKTKGERIYVDSISFKRGIFQLSFGGWKPKSIYKKKIQFKTSNLKSSIFNKEEIDEILNLTFYKTSIKDKKITWKKLEK